MTWSADRSVAGVYCLAGNACDNEVLQYCLVVTSDAKDVRGRGDVLEMSPLAGSNKHEAVFRGRGDEVVGMCFQLVPRRGSVVSWDRFESLALTLAQDD